MPCLTASEDRDNRRLSPNDAQSGKKNYGFPNSGSMVPSVDGISHSPKEFTQWQDCANGTNVLLQTILLIDRAAA
jgi:acetylornithine deacetylase/succinyl-diaminopimelate desuccinylase-like protein